LTYHRDILLGLVAEFDRQEINYCFLRNHSLLSDESHSSGNDIDILILGEQLPLIDKTLKRLRFFRGRDRGETKHVSYGKYVNPQVPILALDLHVDDLSWYEVPYVSGSQVLKRKIRRDNLFVLSNDDNLIMLFVHSSLNGIFKHQYVNAINSIQNSGRIDNEYVKRTLQSVWHRKILKRVWDLVLNGEYQNIIKLRFYLVFSLLIKRRKNLFKFIRYLYITRIREKIRPMFSRTCLVGFMGVDGSGKTTAAHGLHSILERNDVEASIIYMGRWCNHVLPMASVSKKYGMTGNKAPKRRQGIKFRTYCMLRDIAYLADMWLRYWVRLYPKMKKGHTVITDRYAYDLLLDPHCTTLCKVAVKKLFPKPRIVFFLNNEPEIIWERKRELSVEEMKRQIRVFDGLREDYPVVKIKCDDIDKTIDRVAEEYFCRLAS
jgi:thymidylate kinase